MTAAVLFKVLHDRLWTALRGTNPRLVMEVFGRSRRYSGSFAEARFRLIESKATAARRRCRPSGKHVRFDAECLLERPSTFTCRQPRMCPSFSLGGTAPWSICVFRLYIELLA
jgi:hypothetical protein